MRLKFIKQYSFIAGLFACFSNAYSQMAVNYSFSRYTESVYTGISGIGGSTAVPLNCDDCSVTGIPIGFTFRFCGTDYDTLSAASNGYLSLTDTGLTHYRNIDTNITHKGFIMPFWDDLTGVPLFGSPTPPSAYYLTAGIAPNRVFIFEWQNFNRNMSSCTTCTGTFHVKLFETTNAIEFMYGPSGLPIMSGTIGIANSFPDWQTVSGISSGPVTSSSFFIDTLPVLPALGQVYKWEIGNNTVNAVQKDENALRVFPNPGNGEISFLLVSKNWEEGSAVLTDLRGSKMQEMIMETGKAASFTEKVPPGVYFLSVKVASGSYRQTVIVQ
ncbi:MAG: hypothetical protein K0Q79_3114 [Flavipsychrobacter sp.]|jgi:hypothetical protein|nr:hypothetical protein [Flavipsychrobacter sp.]